MTILYRGQWNGHTENNSFVIANINQDKKVISGRISTFESVDVGGNMFSYWLWFTFIGKVTRKDKISGQLFIQSIHHQYGDLLKDEEITELRDRTAIEFPTSVKFKGTLKSDTELEIVSVSTYPSVPKLEQKFKLKKHRKLKSSAPHEPMRWSAFRDYALNQSDEFVYRGQSSNWPLQTSYHRQGYADLVSYLDNQIPELEHHINAVSKHPYNNKDDRSLGALLSLAQHHGYPTPLLDWTKSPYVAAFFAFQNEESLKKGGRISVFVFNEKKWAQRAGRTAQVRSPNNMVRTMELPGFGNPRVLPQQSITMFSNVNDIEHIIESNESFKGEFLKRISIPVSDSKKAMRDLKLMGISWGSMFPGFDGICKQLTSRHFYD